MYFFFSRYFLFKTSRGIPRRSRVCAFTTEAGFAVRFYPCQRTKIPSFTYHSKKEEMARKSFVYNVFDVVFLMLCSHNLLCSWSMSCKFPNIWTLFVHWFIQIFVLPSLPRLQHNCICIIYVLYKTYGFLLIHCSFSF